ncbi:phosphotransferase family protein [Amycolatopsis antarctica]|uniref:phosphotransferase family protein n=1 Tax=Amycolatopsis antarctica TaxID=1854586 RepID=UPI001F0AAED1|nr:aminoglycoside 3'-phosphotransferase/choline kinase family protein [Amycolatopsis antarctica]
MTPAPTASFPRADTEERFRALTPEQLLGPVTGLVAALGHGGARIDRFTEGSLPVYAVGETLVLKLYPPVHGTELAVESGVLRALHATLAVPTPRVRDSGVRDGWGFLLMTRLPGRSLESVWPELSTSDRGRLADRLGRTLAALHRTEAPVLETLEPANWQEWIAGQRRTAAERQRRAGTPETWVEQIPGFLDSVDLGDPVPGLLHTECMREHVMMRYENGEWNASGLFDFEPAMRGAPEYDFAAVGLFVSCGDAAFLRALLLSYGYAPGELGVEFSRRCLAYTLLHRYSNLRWYLDVLPAPPEPVLDSLALTWWGTGTAE